MARQMVCMFGMSDKIGLIFSAQQQNPFGLPGLDGPLQRDCREETAREIDTEVRELLNRAYQSARDILREQTDDALTFAGLKNLQELRDYIKWFSYGNIDRNKCISACEVRYWTQAPGRRASG